MDWKEFAEDYGEHPWEHYEDPADYWDSRGDKARARGTARDRDRAGR